MPCLFSAEAVAEYVEVFEGRPVSMLLMDIAHVYSFDLLVGPYAADILADDRVT